MVRSARVISDKVQDMFGFIFTRTELSEVNRIHVLTTANKCNQLNVMAEQQHTGIHDDDHTKCESTAKRLLEIKTGSWDFLIYALKVPMSLLAIDREHQYIQSLSWLKRVIGLLNCNFCGSHSSSLYFYLSGSALGLEKNATTVDHIGSI